MKKHAIPALVLTLSCLFVLGACAPKRDAAPAKLDTQADLWAEMDGLKAQMRKVNTAVEEMAYKEKSKEGGGDVSLSQLAARVARLEAQITQLASQLAVDLETPSVAPSQGAYPAAAAPSAAYQSAPAQTTSYQTEDGQEGEYLQAEAPGAVSQPSYPVRQPPTQTGDIPPPVVSAPKDPADALYTKALQAFNSKRYQEALGLWTEFSKNFPTNQLIPNCLFWRGEAYFQLGDYANAVLAYQDVIEKHPKSAKYPDALFKRGAAFLKLGNSKAAKLSFQEVIDKYPDSSYAKRAKTMLPK